MSKAPHAACALPEPQRIEYLTAVASILHADGAVVDSEIAKLRALCDALDVSAAGTEEVVAAARQPDPARVSRIVAGYREKDLRFTLLTDAILLAYADGSVDVGESEEIASWAQVLDISTSQAVLIGRYVAEVVHGQDEGMGNLSKDLASGLAQFGPQVPAKGSIRWLYVKLGGK